MHSRQTVLVTGGAGFIGSHIVEGLCASGRDVVVCDTLGSGDKWRNLAKRPLADFVPPGDLTAYLARKPGLSAIVHMGAISSTTETDGDLVVRSNFMLSNELWGWCVEQRVPFLYASSAATYGSGSEGFDDEATSAALARLRPLNLYGWSKHVFDRRVVQLRETGGPQPPQWAGLKFFNVYGPNEYHKGSMQSVVAHLFPKLQAGEPARLFKSYDARYPDGGQMRDFVYVRDCVSVVLWLLEHPKISGLFNVGSGEPRSFADLAVATMTALGVEPRIEFIDMPEMLRGKYQYFTQARLDRLRNAGYSVPMTSLEQGVEEYVRDFLTQHDPYV